MSDTVTPRPGYRYKCHGGLELDCIAIVPLEINPDGDGAIMWDPAGNTVCQHFLNGVADRDCNDRLNLVEEVGPIPFKYEVGIPAVKTPWKQASGFVTKCPGCHVITGAIVIRDRDRDEAEFLGALWSLGLESSPKPQCGVSVQKAR